MNTFIVKIACGILGALLLMYCQAEKKQDKYESNYAEFMSMNIFHSEEFAIAPYAILNDMHGKPCRIDSILKKPKLIFRFGERNRELCIESEVKLINELGLTSHIVGFADYSNNRMIQLAKEKYKIQFPIYYLPKGAESLIPKVKDEIERPYLFLMATDYRAKYIFYPSVGFPEMSRKYYHEIGRLFNDHSLNENFFEEKIVDMGNIIKGKTYNVSFKYVNKTPGPLLIEDIRPSCGCAVPQWDKIPIRENKSSELVISFTPETLGYNSKTIMVTHNKSKHPVRLIIKANVE